MVPARKKPAVESHVNESQYKGRLAQQQQEGNKFRGQRYMQYEGYTFTEYQNALYRRVMYGLEAIPQEEVKYMHPEKQKRITKVQFRARQAVNSLKQEILIGVTNSLFLSEFWNSEFMMKLVKNYSVPDPKVKDKFTPKMLRLNKITIANRLIEIGILPGNFYELKKDPNAKRKLPRLKQPADSILVSH